MKKNGIIILSGGMDSTTLLYDFKKDIALALSFDYQSKHNKKELAFAKYHCQKLGIKHFVINLDFIDKFFASSLLKSGTNIPDGHYEDENMKSTVVPFRNGIMLSIAAGIAESNGLSNIYIGNHAGDHAIYPDCRPNFINYMSDAITAGTYVKVEIKAQYTNINKRQIALIGKELGVDYSKTWTCYKGRDKHCGKCGSCVERQEALNGFDTTEYE